MNYTHTKLISKNQIGRKFRTCGRLFDKPHQFIEWPSARWEMKKISIWITGRCESFGISSKLFLFHYADICTTWRLASENRSRNSGLVVVYLISLTLNPPQHPHPQYLRTYLMMNGISSIRNDRRKYSLEIYVFMFEPHPQPSTPSTNIIQIQL